MKFVNVALIALSASAPAFATTVCGELKAVQVFCVRAPCPALKTLTDGRGKPYAVRAEEGSPVEKFLENMRPGKYRVCVEGRIERENLLVAREIRIGRR